MTHKQPTTDPTDQPETTATVEPEIEPQEGEIEPTPEPEVAAEEPQEPISNKQMNEAMATFVRELIPLEPRTLTEAVSVAKIFTESGLFQDVHSWQRAFVKIAAGREMGVPAFAAMSGIHIIKGKTVVGAHLIAAGIRRSEVYDFRTTTLNNNECVIEFFKYGKLIGISTFTIADARAAKVYKDDSGWTKYPRNMLFARAISNGYKWFSPDVFDRPVYTYEEMGLEVDEDGFPVAIDVEFEYKPEEHQEKLGPGDPIKPPPSERRLDTSPHNPVKEGPTHSSRPVPDDTPWQKVIKDWKNRQWTDYWVQMQKQPPEGRGLTNQEVHIALGVEHVKEFAGTIGEHRKLTETASKRKQQGLDVVTPDELAEEASVEPGPPAQPKGVVTRPGTPFYMSPLPEEKTEADPPAKPGVVSTAAQTGYSTISKATATARPGKKPKLVIHAMDDAGVEDQIPIFDGEIAVSELRKVFGGLVPKPLSQEGSTLYAHEGKGYPEKPLMLEWNRDENDHLELVSVIEF